MMFLLFYSRCASAGLEGCCTVGGFQRALVHFYFTNSHLCRGLLKLCQSDHWVSSLTFFPVILFGQRSWEHLKHYKWFISLP